MGKATILSSYGEGKYRVQVNYDRTRAEAEISRLQTEISGIDSALPDLQDAIDAAILDLDYTHEVLDAAVHAYQVDPTDANKATVETVQGGVREAQNQLRSARQTKSLAELKRTAAQKRIEFLQDNMPDDRETDAWCADYTEDLTGEVGTVEIGRTDLESPVIRPGDGAAHQSARDGQLQPVLSGTAASTFFNYAMLPGAGKHRPRYRIGEITSLDSALAVADVALDPATSTHQDLDINQTDVLADVPVVYLDCHAEAFEAGDRVVVEFTGQSWDSPRIIGFESQPRPCAAEGMLCSSGLIRWGGSAYSLKTAVPAGNIDWRGHGKSVLSWIGMSRYFDPAGISAYVDPSADQTALYRRGNILLNCAESKVAGAALISGDRVVYVGAVVTVSEFGAESVSEERIYVADLSDTGTPRLIATLTWPTGGGFGNHTPWLFNASGTEATAVRLSAEGSDVYLHRHRITLDPDAESASVTDAGRCAWRNSILDASITYATGVGHLADRIDYRFLLEDYAGDTRVTGEVLDTYREEYGYSISDGDGSAWLEKDHRLIVDIGGVTVMDEALCDLRVDETASRQTDPDRLVYDTVTATDDIARLWVKSLDLRNSMIIWEFYRKTLTSTINQQAVNTLGDDVIAGESSFPAGTYDYTWKWVSRWGAESHSETGPLADDLLLGGAGYNAFKWATSTLQYGLSETNMRNAINYAVDYGGEPYEEVCEEEDRLMYRFNPATKLDGATYPGTPLRSETLVVGHLSNAYWPQEKAPYAWYAYDSADIKTDKTEVHYPGEPSRVMISAPMAKIARVSEWTSAGGPWYLHLTGGDIEEVTGSAEPVPLGAV
jgi:hypothetical protein